MPEWLKSGGIVILGMIIWDIVRIPIQAWVTKKFMEKDFDDLEEAIEDEDEKETK